MLTFELVNSLFVYNDGCLFRKLKTGLLSSQAAGTKTSNGYIKIDINKKSYLAHRIVYLLHHKILPEFIDHIDGNPLNNKIENLRSCSKSQNNMNSKKRKSNISGHRNVSYRPKFKQWAVELQANKVRYHFGFYKDFDVACSVADEARNSLHKEFAKNV